MESRGIRLIRELNGFITGTGTNERMKNEQKRTKARARARAKRVARHNAIGSRTIILYPLCPSPLSLSLPLLPLPPSFSLTLFLSPLACFPAKWTEHKVFESCKAGVIPWRRGCARLLLRPITHTYHRHVKYSRAIVRFLSSRDPRSRIASRFSSFSLNILNCGVSFSLFLSSSHFFLQRHR